MEATAVADADTVPAETEAPEEAIQDTAEESPEGTDTEEQATDTRDFEAEKAEAVEAARKAAIEEARKDFEEESVLNAYRNRTRQQGQWLASQAANEAQKFAEYVVGEVESGRMTGAQILASIKPENLAKGWAGMLAGAVQSEQLVTAYALQDGNLKKAYPDWRVPNDLARAKEKALAEGDTATLYQLRDEIWKRAVLENEVPKAAQELAKSEQEKNKKAAEVAKTLNGDKTRASAPAPTAVSGSGAPASISNFHEASVAYNQGRITGTQYADYAKKFNQRLD